MALFSAEEVGQAVERAGVASVLRGGGDYVSAGQLQALRRAVEEARRLNTQRVLPALPAYADFVENVVAHQQREREEAQRAALQCREQHTALLHRLAAASNVQAQQRDVEALKRQAADAQTKCDALAAEVQAADAQRRAYEEALERAQREEVNTALLVENDERLLLQKAELESLEKEYLKTEQAIFALQREVSAVKEGNAELLRICENLLRKAEGK